RAYSLQLTEGPRMVRNFLPMIVFLAVVFCGGCCSVWPWGSTIFWEDPVPSNRPASEQGSPGRWVGSFSKVRGSEFSTQRLMVGGLNAPSTATGMPPAARGSRQLRPLLMQQLVQRVLLPLLQLVRQPVAIRVVLVPGAFAHDKFFRHGLVEPGPQRGFL